MTKERNFSPKKIVIYTVLIMLSLTLIFHQKISYFVTDMTIRHSSKITGVGLEPEYDVEEVKPYSAEAAVQAMFSAKDVRAKGQISIPSVGMSLPIYEGLNDVHLYLGAAEHSPRSHVTAGQTGNYILASHYIANRGSLFEPLPRVSSGDKIYVASGDKVFEYEAESIQKINVSDDSWIEDSEDKIITLYTCVSLDAPDLRWLVRGRLVKSHHLDESLDKEILESFSIDSTLKGTYLESYEWLRPD